MENEEINKTMLFIRNAEYCKVKLYNVINIFQVTIFIISIVFESRSIEGLMIGLTFKIINYEECKSYIIQS